MQPPEQAGEEHHGPDAAEQELVVVGREIGQLVGDQAPSQHEGHQQGAEGNAAGLGGPGHQAVDRADERHQQQEDGKSQHQLPVGPVRRRPGGVGRCAPRSGRRAGDRAGRQLLDDLLRSGENARIVVATAQVRRHRVADDAPGHGVGQGGLQPVTDLDSHPAVG